jgi:hypothetical protein
MLRDQTARSATCSAATLARALDQPSRIFRQQEAVSHSALMNSSFQERDAAGPCHHSGAMKGFDGYLFLLPSGAGGHGDDADRLRALAAFNGYEDWLLGCRDAQRAGGRHARRRVVVTPLGAVGAPGGTLAAALAAAGALDGCDYVMATADAGTP